MDRDEGFTSGFSSRLIVIGASAGGPGILLDILKKLPESTSGIVVVQHLCQGFTSHLVKIMKEQCRMKVKEAADLEPVCDGTVYLAAAGSHLKVMKGKMGFYLRYSGKKLCNGVCPSADVLFASAACAGNMGMGIILSGMGKDGAEGLLQMRRAGAMTIGQNKASSPVYGMPYEAKKAGAVMIECTPEQIAEQIIRFSGREE